MTRLTAIIIRTRGDDVHCQAGGPDRDGKWAGWVSLFRNEAYDHALLTTKAIYASEEEAVAAMQQLVAAVRGMTDAEVSAD